MTKDNKKDALSLISTLPKSGTWFLLTFFWCYQQMLNNHNNGGRNEFVPDLSGALRDGLISETTSLEPLENLIVCHSGLPGFEQGDDPLFDRWNALKFPFPYNWAEGRLKEESKWEELNPFTHKDVRIVYVYRNPLDHLLSYFRFGQKHVDDIHRTKILSDGTRVPVTELHDFVFDFGGLDGFIKHYYPFKQMSLKLPNNILMVSYESLITNQNEIINEILKFINMDSDTSAKRAIVSRALAMCTKDALLSIEEKMGRSMNGMMQGKEKHIQCGKIGKWIDNFSSAEIEAIEYRLNEFNISLNEFNLFSTSMIKHEYNAGHKYNTYRNSQIIKKAIKGKLYKIKKYFFKKDKAAHG